MSNYLDKQSDWIEKYDIQVGDKVLFDGDNVQFIVQFTDRGVLLDNNLLCDCDCLSPLRTACEDDVGQTCYFNSSRSARAVENTLSQIHTLYTTAGGVSWPEAYVEKECLGGI